MSLGRSKYNDELYFRLIEENYKRLRRKIKVKEYRRKKRDRNITLAKPCEFDFDIKIEEHYSTII